MYAMAALQWLAGAVALAVLALAVPRLPWHKLQGDPEAQRVLGMATMALVLLRVFNTHGLAGVQLNFTGAMVAVLMFGPAFALWALAVASLVAWPFGYAWLGPGPDFLATAAVPVALGWAWSRFCERRLPPNLFLYVLVQGFLGGALAIAASNLGKYLAAAWLELPGAGFYLLATPLMMFGEAFLTGGAMALIVVYRPHWCSTFDDARYLRPR
ncbi:energy-coupling factor ABC transporter permease [Pseudoxanthomonas mexicana]|uniref:Energy-coupling factor ABC transporter permease n=2 Tax=Pseudoxanthomonas mexicana TaxID=128785 RepID=A0ABX6RBH4_PSEMX|nr:MAG: energy-coupling factor ABC transporter permease [Pseudoxanthomonas sp.]QND79828.1 energy-coupling factor ABC transporter permease [Pseudoxanthomonas mexicana]